MTWHRINPLAKAELPDIEIWPDLHVTVKCRKCGIRTGPEGMINDPDKGVVCPKCGKKAKMTQCSAEQAFFYWFCVPGCTPVSDPCGPYTSETEALDSARAFVADLD